MIEVVYMSDDMNEKHFELAFDAMKWAALPFHMHDQKATIKQNFGVNGVPCAIVLN
jgi:hypothetical protein